MIRFVWKGAIAAALTSAGLLAPTFAAPQTPAAKGDEKKDEHTMLLKQDGKPDRKCVIVSTTRRADGSLAHKVKALDDGEEMTVLEPAPGKTTAPKADPVADTIPTAQNPPRPATTKTETKPQTGKLNPAPTPEKAPPPVTAARPDFGLLRDRTKNEAPVEPKLLPPETSQPRRILPAPAEPSRPGLFKRLFGRSSKPEQPSSPVEIAPRPVTVPQPSQTAPPPLADPFSSSLKPQTRALPTEGNAVVQASASVVAKIPEPTLRTIPAPAARGGKSAGDHMIVLRDALAPTERENAALALAEGSQGKSTEIRAALFAAVKNDPAATVRACCLTCLAKQGLNDAIMKSALDMAQKDADARVREAAREAASMK